MVHLSEVTPNNQVFGLLSLFEYDPHASICTTVVPYSYESLFLGKSGHDLGERGGRSLPDPDRDHCEERFGSCLCYQLFESLF